MTDVTPTHADESCGCCRPPDKTRQDVVNDLMARRQAVDERLHQLEPAGPRGPNAMAGLRVPNATVGAAR